MATFHTKLRLVEAEQFFEDGPLPFNRRGPYVAFNGGRFRVTTAHGQTVDLTDGDWVIPEPSGPHVLSYAAYLVKPDIFAANYEPDAVPGVASPAPVEDQRALTLARAALQYPPNGHHYCRWCDAGTKNHWRHSESCDYVRQVTAIDEARAAIDARLAARAGSRVAPAPEGLGAFLNSPEFYDLMQTYRHTPLLPPGAVVDAYEAVKAALRLRLAPSPAPEDQS